MISIPKYSSDFEDEYFDRVYAYLTEKDVTCIHNLLESCKKYLPPGFYENGAEDVQNFKRLILATYSDLVEAKQYIDSKSNLVMRSECFYVKRKPKVIKSGAKSKKRVKVPEIVKTTQYEAYVSFYTSIMRLMLCGNQVNVAILIKSKLLTCPYCNREYINHRSPKHSGAQLDHFFNKDKYPFFALSLYNLVPTCGNCNRIKSAKDTEIVSPFDESVDMNKSIRFSYHPEDANAKIRIETNDRLKVNKDELRLEEMYQIHSLDAMEIEDKVRVYCHSLTGEIEETFGRHALTIGDLERALFGSTHKTSDFGKRSLAKFRNDVTEQLLNHRGVSKKF